MAMGGDLTTSWYDAGTIISAPAHFSSGQWLATAALLPAPRFLTVIGRCEILRRATSPPSARRLQMSEGNMAMRLPVVSSARQYMPSGSQPITNLRVVSGKDDARITSVFRLHNACSQMHYRAQPAYTGEGPTKFNWFQIVNNDNRSSLWAHHVDLPFPRCSRHESKTHMRQSGYTDLRRSRMGARIYEDEHWFSDTFWCRHRTVIGNAVASFTGDSHPNNPQSLQFTPSLK